MCVCARQKENHYIWRMNRKSIMNKNSRKVENPNYIFCFMLVAGRNINSMGCSPLPIKECLLSTRKFNLISNNNLHKI
uniref:Uncharacterized protein n=1 Tax=Lepeophtheirus salmonis TaxID=72036 RepID=A0A0K2TAL4_LEPSM